MTARAFITGVGGTALTAFERAFLGDAQPWGFILFTRNVASPEQVRALVADMRLAVGRDAPVLIDQEGGIHTALRPLLSRGDTNSSRMPSWKRGGIIAGPRILK